MHIRHQRFLIPIAVLGSVIALLGCYHATRLAATWRDPDANAIHFRQPVVVFVSKDIVFRHTMEDKMAAQFPNAVPSYRVLANANVGEGTAVLNELDHKGYDGAIMHVVEELRKQGMVAVACTSSHRADGSPRRSEPDGRLPRGRETAR